MHLFKRFPATPLLAPEDAGSGSSGAVGDEHDPGATGADDALSSTGEADDEFADDGGDAGADDDSGSQGSEDDDDEALLFGDDADQADAGRPAEERLAALAKKHVKLKRKFGKNWSLIKSAKSLGITERELGDIVTKARNFDALQQGGAESKRLLRQLIGDEEPEPRRTTGKGKGRASDEDDDDEFDESALPFDTTTDSGKYFARQARESHELKQNLKKALKRLESIEGGVNAVNGRIETDKKTALARTWSEKAAASAKLIPHKGQRTLFVDNLRLAFPTYGGKVPVEKVIKHYLDQLGIKPRTAAIANGAGQQRIAQRNQERPRMGGGQGTPAPANGGQRPKTLADVHRKLRQTTA